MRHHLLLNCAQLSGDFRLHHLHNLSCDLPTLQTRNQRISGKNNQNQRRYTSEANQWNIMPGVWVRNSFANFKLKKSNEPTLQWSFSHFTKVFFPAPLEHEWLFHLQNLLNVPPPPSCHLLAVPECERALERAWPCEAGLGPGAKHFQGYHVHAL